MGPLATTPQGNASNSLDLSATGYHLTIPFGPFSAFPVSVLVPINGWLNLKAFSACRRLRKKIVQTCQANTGCSNARRT